MSGDRPASLAFSAVSAGSLVGFDLELGPGLHVVLGADSDGASVIAELAAGVARPRRGAVRILGEAPYRSPAARRRVGALLATESLPDAGSVEATLDCCLGARGADVGGRVALERSGLGHLAQARVLQLDRFALRAVALAAALADPAPEVLVLHEPFAYGADRVRDVASRIEAAAALGRCVVIVTASAADAARTRGPVTLLRGGRALRSIEEPFRVHAAPGAAELLVTCSDARGLAAALARDPAVDRAVLDARAAGVVAVAGPDPVEVARAVARAARATGARVTRLERRVATLAEVAAASAGLARGAWEAARRVALGQLGPERADHADASSRSGPDPRGPS